MSKKNTRIVRPWPTSDKDITVLEAAQAMTATGEIAEAIEDARQQLLGCFFGDHQTLARGGTRAWIIVHKAPSRKMSARPVCARCGWHYGNTFMLLAEARHQLFERPTRRRFDGPEERRERKWKPRRFVHRAPEMLQ